MPDIAEINLFEQMPYKLVATRKDTGEIIPDAVISDITWIKDNDIGEFILDPANPTSAIFRPSKAGTVHISAKAGSITIP